MPFCTSCGDVFEGRGSFCIYHNPYAFSKSHNESYSKHDTTNFPLVKYRTGGPNNRHNKSYKFKDYDEKYYDQTCDQRYDPNDLSIVPYQRAYNPNYSNGLQVSNSQLASVAAQTFTRLASQYAIDSMTFSTSACGEKSVAVTANKEREQCAVCRKWFPDHPRLLSHQWEHTSGCEIHGVCFGKEDEYYHATSCRHDRCFVKGCASVYRKEGGWKGSAVEAHVKEWHL